MTILYTSCSGYTIEKQSAKTGKWEKVSSFVPKDAKSFQVTKLKEGEKYKFRVTAENRNGPSEPLETETTTLAKNPYGKWNHYFIDITKHGSIYYSYR